MTNVSENSEKIGGLSFTSSAAFPFLVRSGFPKPGCIYDPLGFATIHRRQNPVFVLECTDGLVDPPLGDRGPVVGNSARPVLLLYHGRNGATTILDQIS